MIRLESSRQHDRLVARLVEALQAALEPLRDSTEPDAALAVMGESDRRNHYHVVVEMHPPGETRS
jgi:hypothetical protein